MEDKFTYRRRRVSLNIKDNILCMFLIKNIFEHHNIYYPNEVEHVILIAPMVELLTFLFQDFAKILQKNAVAYVSLHSPVRGNTSLHPVASPSLQQLVLEVRWTRCGGIVTQDCILLSKLRFLNLFHLSIHKMICNNF